MFYFPMLVGYLALREWTDRAVFHSGTILKHDFKIIFDFVFILQVYWRKYKPFGKSHNIHVWCICFTCAFPHSNIYPIYEKVPSHPGRCGWEQKKRWLHVKSVSSMFCSSSKISNSETHMGYLRIIFSDQEENIKGQTWEHGKNVILPVISFLIIIMVWEVMAFAGIHFGYIHI